MVPGAHILSLVMRPGSHIQLQQQSASQWKGIIFLPIEKENPHKKWTDNQKGDGHSVLGSNKCLLIEYMLRVTAISATG